MSEATGPLCPVCQRFRCAARRNGGYFSTCFRCRNTDPAAAPAAPPAPPARPLNLLPPDDPEQMRLVHRDASHAARTGRPAPAMVAPVAVEGWISVADDGTLDLLVAYADPDGYQGRRWLCSCGYRGGFPCEHVRSAIHEMHAQAEEEYQRRGA